MKLNNFKHSIWNLLLTTVFMTFTILMLIVMSINRETFGIVLSVVLFCVAIFSTLISVADLQWFVVENDKIVVRNIFGTINEVKYLDIKNCFIINAVILFVRMATFRKPYIVLATNKTCQKGLVEDAYNKKRKKYIIIPYTENNVQLIKEKYKLCTGKELIL